jgi:lipoprotein-anchoring transpeptidase ErfK/SrfK
MNTLDRRSFVFAGLASLIMSGRANAAPRSWYKGSIPDRPFDIPLVDKSRIPKQFHRAVVAYSGPESAGTILIDKAHFHLFRVEGGGKAVRYGIAVGRDGARWHGEAVVGRKARWPTWTPTANMRRRNPSLPVRMPGGPQNPLGARALYLYRDGRDTLYRIHGTNEPGSIGHAASSGCIRMLNEHVLEVFDETPVGARVVVL